MTFFLLSNAKHVEDRLCWFFSFFMGTEAFRLQHRTQKPHKNKDAVWLQRTWNKALESYGSRLCYFYVLCPFWSLHALVSIHCYCLDQQGKQHSAFFLMCSDFWGSHTGLEWQEGEPIMTDNFTSLGVLFLFLFQYKCFFCVFFFFCYYSICGLKDS